MQINCNQDETMKAVSEPRKTFLMFPCQYCQKSFNDAAHLRIHLKTHSGTKPHKWNIWDYASTDTGRLRRHTKFTLEKSRTNACNVTLHVFKQLIWEDTWRLTLEQSHTNASNLCIQAGNLRIHLRTHSGTKRWTICTILDHLDCSTIAIAVTWIRFCIWVWIWFAAGRWNRKSGNWSVTHENECFVQGFQMDNIQI